MFSVMAYGSQLQNPWVPVAFLTGGFFSGLSGYLGMKTATYASARTANAARTSLNAGLRIAFRSGAVMGLVVVGLGLIDISFWYLLLDWRRRPRRYSEDAMITTTMLTFGMGASTQALFARVGGGAACARPPTWAPTSWARSRPVFPRIRAESGHHRRQRGRQWSATWPAWAPTSTESHCRLDPRRRRSRSTLPAQRAVGTLGD